LAFGKHVAMEFIPHVVGETILKGAGTAALFAGDEDEDAEMERFMQIIADKMASEKITPELMTQMVDSYNAKKDEGDTVNEEVRELTPDQSEMVQGIIDMLLQIDDIDNRMKVAQQQIQNFKDEEIVFNYAWFLSAAGLDNNDEPVRMDVKTQPQHIINKESIMIGKINEDFKHIIHVDTPTQVVSKPIAAQILALAKKGIRSKDIGLEMGFVGNAKLATDAFQKVKNKIYFELGNKNESVITEDTKRANILGIDFNISEMNGRIFFSFIDKKAASLKIREIGTNKIVNLIQKSLDNAYGKGEFFFKGGDHAEFQNGYLFQRNLTNVKLNKLKFESVNEVASRTAMEIGGLTGMNKDAIQKFVDEHNLDIEKVFQFVKKGKLPARMDFMTAVVGKPGNPIQKKIIKMLSESVNEGAHGMATKILQSVVNGDSSRAEGTKMSKELAQHYIDWIRTSPFGKKNGNLPLDMLVKASFNWGIERGLDSKLKGELSKLKSTIKESVNEVKYPTNLYVGSVIYGQGFTGLKGIEGGKYYKVVEMDDTTATLVPSDQKGKITGSKKVRHKLSSIEGGIKTAKRGDENGIVIESVNEERILVRKVMGDDAEKFLKKYPKVKQVMSVIAKKNTDLMKGYKAFLKFKDAQEDYLGGRAEVSSSPTFGSKTFYKYDWGNLKNHWPEVYQYIYTLHFGGLDGATVEGINEAMGNDKSMLALADVLSNSMEHYDEKDFLQSVRGGQGWSGIAGFQNSGLIPVFKSIYKKYWTVSPQNRTNWSLKDWTNWLKPFGLEENWDSEMDTVEESTPGEQIQNLNNRLTKLRQDMAKAKSPEAKNIIQARMKNALQSLSNKKKDLGIKKP
jgi:hypothetical protein